MIFTEPFVFHAIETSNKQKKKTRKCCVSMLIAVPLWLGCDKQTLNSG